MLQAKSYAKNCGFVEMKVEVKVEVNVEVNMDRIEKLKNDMYSFEELDTMEKNATKLRDGETLSLIQLSRASKAAKGEQPSSLADED